MGNANGRISNPAPLDYVTPRFPGLYWPFDAPSGAATYLYYSNDIWRFTLFWTIIIFEASHLAASGYAVAMQWKNWKLMWIVPVIYMIVGAVEALLAGSVVGLILGAVYNAGYFRMSTWIPFTWALINVLVLILASFSMQGGL